MKKSIVNLLLVSFLLLPVLARAATVTSIEDSGPGSLRHAIASAPPGDTITFAVTGTITLTTGEVLINKSITIEGPGANQLTIQRSQASSIPDFRIFHVASGTVVISGLAIAKGSIYNGAGVLNEATLRLENCVIMDNSATAAGAGIYNTNTLTMVDCAVFANTVQPRGGSGAGIYNAGTLAVLNCTISSNSVTGLVTGGASAGGIRNRAGILSLTNSIVAWNSAIGGTSGPADGGGIYNEDTLVLDTSTVAANIAVGGAGTLAGTGNGGGIENRGGTITVVRSTLSSNTVVTGNSYGPIAVGGGGGGLANYQGKALVENSTISGNLVLAGGTNAAASAGGILSVFGDLTLDHSTITANSSFAHGRISPGNGLAAGGSETIKNTILAGNAGVDVTTYYDTRSEGNNVFGSVAGPFIPYPTDQIDIGPATLRLGPLGDNGGPTLTHALLCGSPAINAGDNTDAPPTDQRGFPRIVGGVMDVGAFEFSDNPPTVTFPTPLALTCAPPSGKLGTLSVTVADLDGNPLAVVWGVNGEMVQTNFLPASSAPAATPLELTALFPLGTNAVTVSVTDPSECVASCSTTVTVLALGGIYPIALSIQTIAGLPAGSVIEDILNGNQPGDFGWLSWVGKPTEPALIASLTPPGNSDTYINPRTRRTDKISVGDWVRGKSGVSNSDQVRQALESLEKLDITIPVWDKAVGHGNTSLYRVAGFARIRLLSYHLPHQNRISARFLDFFDCR